MLRCALDADRPPVLLDDAPAEGEPETGAARSITPPTPPAGYVRYPVWAPGGDSVLYEQGSWNGNLWVAELPEG